MSNQPNSQATRCTATTRRGQPCRAWAVPGTDPPRCAPHGGVDARPGAPEGNQNASTHGHYAKQWGCDQPQVEPMFESQPVQNHAREPETESANTGAIASVVPDIIPQISKNTTESSQIMTYLTQDMFNKYKVLSGYIDRHLAELSLPALVHLLNLQGQMATRLGHLLRDQLAIKGSMPSSVDNVMDRAFDELSIILGKQL